ncbi:MAG: nucleotide exchange factor GrpE [Proteiniphilum sp.]
MSSNNQSYRNSEEFNEKEFDGREEIINDETGDKMADETEVQLEEAENDLQQKYDELNDSYLRLHAEFDNFRKRTLKEKADLIKGGGERVLLDIVTLVDDFERALESLHKTEDREAMLEGMDLIYSKFIAFLKQHGVSEIEAIGQPFDAESFEAVTTIPAPEASQKGVVVDCIQKGYRLNGKIIRFPKVIVGE